MLCGVVKFFCSNSYSFVLRTCRKKSNSQNSNKKKTKKWKRKKSLGRRRKRSRNHGDHAGKCAPKSNPVPTKRVRTTVPHAKTSSLAVDITAQDQRVAIYVFWQKSLGACGPSEWKGHDGAISAILRCMDLPQGNYKTVLKVLEDAWKLHLRGELYLGNHRLTGRTSNNKPLIAPGSKDEQLIADLMEDGSSYRKVTRRVNMQRKLDNPNKIHIGMSAVRTCVKRLNPDVTAVTARSQGSNDPKSPWACARYDIFQQFRLRLRRIKFRELTIMDQLKPCFYGLSEHRLSVGSTITHHSPHITTMSTLTHMFTHVGGPVHLLG